MADTLETLELEVKHSATGAADEIKRVASAVRSLGRALENVLPTLSVFQKTLGKNSFNVVQNDNSQIANTINNVKTTASQAGKATKEASRGIQEMSKAASKSKSPLDNFVGSLKRIAFYRFIRSIIKAITQAFQEGLQNAYQFSSGIEGEGHRFAAALDSMKTAGSTMKNQLGAAFIALLTALAPIINTIIGLITKLADALSQIFSVFTGKTYLKAAEVPQKWAEGAGGAAKAAKEWKNQLLGFDEINRLEEPSDGGGGGGGGGIDPSSMFTDSPIEEWALRLKEKLEPIINDIKLMFEGLIDFLKGVFTGDWDLAFQGLGKILEGFGSLVEHVLEMVIIPLFDGFSQKVIEIIGSLFDWIQEKTGIDLSAWKQSILFQLNFIRFYIEGVATQIGWCIKDLCDVVSAVLQGDWDKAWESAKQLVSDASVNIIPTVTDMAWKVTQEMMGVSDEVSKHSESSHTSVNKAAVGIANDVIGAGNASATFAETFSDNMDAVRGQMSAMGQSSLTLNDTGNSLSFVARVVSAVSNIKRAFANMDMSAGAYGLFANGGYPESGQLFFAREDGAGAEMVGTVGGRTAVASNDDILNGIRQGVYEAVSAAMANNGTGEPVVRVYLDSREIKNGQNRLARSMGVG